MNSVCRRRSVSSKCVPKTSVNSVRSVREKTIHAPHKKPSRGNLTYQLPVGPSPVPSPEGKGRNHRDTPIRRVYASFYPLTGSLVGVTSHITPLPSGEGPGEGPVVSGVRPPMYSMPQHLSPPENHTDFFPFSIFFFIFVAIYCEIVTFYQ